VAHRFLRMADHRSVGGSMWAERRAFATRNRASLGNLWRWIDRSFGLAELTLRDRVVSVSRAMRVIPSVPAFLPSHWPGPVEREKVTGGVITRRVSLKQRVPGKRISARR